MYLLGKFIDLTGQKFGKLSVVKKADDYVSAKGYHEIQWLCICDCGKETIVRGSSLRKGNTSSCGCIHKMFVSNLGKENKKYNEYDLNEKFGIGFTTKGEEFYFDLEDYEKIKNYCWYVNHGYVVTDVKGKLIQMHRLVMNCPNDKCVDHMNHNTEDNRKENLRICTNHENSLNTQKQNRQTSSKYKGVCFDKKSNKWRAIIAYEGKQKYLGIFENEKDAAIEYNKYAIEIFGEYANINIF